MTPRQELIRHAGIRLRVWRNRKAVFISSTAAICYPRAHHAIEAIVDECLSCKSGTLGTAMIDYYRHATEVAITRLIYAVDSYAGACAGRYKPAEFMADQ